MKLTVILRTCLRSKLDEGIKDFTRICGSDRRAMVLKCLQSLVNSINHSSAEVKLIILDDNSDADFLEEVHAISNAEIIMLAPPDDMPSFNFSAFRQFQVASEVEGLVYSVEDDYLHTEDAIETMINAHAYLSGRFYNDTVMVFPFDCPFRYEQGKEEPTILLHDGSRYWRQVNATTNTFLTMGSTIKKHFDVFSKLALEYPNVNEQHTINKLYKRFGTENGSITVFNPIPSVAYHLSYASPVEIKTPVNWRQLWE